MRKRKWEGRRKGKGGEGDRDGSESLGERVGKRGGEGKFRGPGPPNVFS